jgi:hypothetical protein
MAPTPAIKIQPAVEADGHAVLACLAQAFAPYRQCYSAEAFLNTILCLETLKYRMKKMLVLVAVKHRRYRPASLVKARGLIAVAIRKRPTPAFCVSGPVPDHRHGSSGRC